MIVDSGLPFGPPCIFI